jgi:hypothetical protein
VPPGCDWILIEGQSNAVGYGGPLDATNGDTAFPQNISQYVNYNTGNAFNFLVSTLQPHTEPLYASQAFNPNKVGFYQTFARRYAINDLASNRKVCLLVTAYPSTGFKTGQWIPGGIQSLNTLAWQADAFKLGYMGPGSVGRVVVVLWHQGETDAGLNNTDTTLFYQNAISQHIDSTRSNNPLMYPSLPFIVGGMVNTWYLSQSFGAAAAAAPNGNLYPINLALSQISTIRNFTCYADSAGTTPDGSNIHFDGPSAHAMGNRYYDCWKSLQPYVGYNYNFPLVPLPTDLLGYWPLNGNFSGVDGNGNVLALTPSVVGAPGVSFQSRELTTNQNVLVHSSSIATFFDTSAPLISSYTIQFWVFFNYNEGGGYIAQGSNWNLALSNGFLRIARNPQQVLSTQLFTFGTWVFTAVTFNYSTNVARFYENGVVTVTSSGLGGAISPFQLQLFGTVGAFSCSGAFSRVRAWKRELSFNELESYRISDLAQMGYRSPVQKASSQTGMLLYMPLNGTYNDFSGNGLITTASGSSMISFAYDSFASAVVMQKTAGLNSWIYVSEAYLPAKFTIQLFYNIQKTNNNPSVFVGSTNSTVGYWGFGPYYTSPYIYPGFTKGSGLVCTDSSPMIRGAWQHSAVTFDGTTLKTYRNGALVCSNGMSGYYGGLPLYTFFQNAGDTSLSSFSQLQVFDRAITATEVLTASQLINTVASFPYSALAVNVSFAQDITDNNGYTTTLIQGVGVQAATPLPSKYANDLSASSAVTVGWNLPLNFTLSGWARIQGGSTLNTYIAVTNSSVTGNGAVSLYLGGQFGNQICCSLYAAAVSTNLCSGGTLTLSNNIWIHAACSYNTASTILNVYYNGVMVVNGAVPTAAATSYASQTTTYPLSIGMPNIYHSTNRPLSELSTVMAFNAELTPTQVYAVYNSQK